MMILNLDPKKVIYVFLFNFSEYIENACDHVIEEIQNCCLNFMDGHCPCKRRGIEILAKLVRKDMKKMIDPDVSSDEKRKISSHQQKGGGSFSLLLGMVLPALVCFCICEIKYYELCFVK